MATRQFIIKSLEKQVKELERKAVEEVSKDIEKGARRNFNRVIDEVPADDPYVEVYRIKPNEKTAKVICRGDQVLFIEFGAGIHEATKTSTVVSTMNGDVEWASRPNGIYPIGGYGNHHGLDDFWFYKSETGRGSTNAEQIRYNSRKGTYTMLTIGIRPVRALYRAIGNSFRKLGSGRLKLK